MNEYSTVLVEMKNHMQVIENTLNLQAQTLSTIAKVLAVIEDRTRS
jgi:two-component sensor histidine kinase